MVTRPVRVPFDDLVLRQFEPGDEAQLSAAFADARLQRWHPVPVDAEAEAAFADRRNDWGTGTHAAWVVAEADGDDGPGRLLGSVSLQEIDVEGGDAEIGYWLAPWARGRGVATRSVLAATSWAYSALGLHRVYLYHSVENTASCAVAGRAGFLLEGTLRQSFRYQDGRLHDEHLHARLSSD
ncbi:GNAT family N-acetyltransferase [Nocardioides sp. LHG3406-4]|uniref:GNAT family N-acetyltransferase n=1 Tax=Nocardioides sp. LHG3406-4 TaxID=2804575 RepID=UPI003CF6DB9F